MNRLLPSFAALAALVLAAPLPGHGGLYRGPGSTFPPGPSVPPASPPALPGLPSSPGPSSPGYRADSDSWSVWWGLNREPLLDLKRSIWGLDTVTGSDAFFLGRGQRDPGPETLRPDPTQLQEEVVPLLLQMLREETSNDVLTAALVAVAKIGAGPDDAGGARIEAALREFLDDPNQDVRETAAVALGILGRTPSAFLLADLLEDTPAGRSAVGSTTVSERTRAFAAFGLGLVGRASEREDVRRYAVGKLVRALETDTSATKDVGVACVISLGLLPLAVAGGQDPAALRPSASRQGEVRFLLALLGNPKVEPVVRAHVPVAAARLAAGTDLVAPVATACADRLDPHSKAWAEVREGATLALGLLGDDDADDVDARIRATLTRQATAGKSTRERRFALIALARNAARPGSGGDAGVGAQETRALLLRTLSRGTTTVRPWAALALALLERGRARQGATPAPEVGAALRTVMRPAVSPEEVGGLAVALGLLPDLEAKPLLVEKIDRLRQDDVRGYAAIGLGLLHAREAAPVLRRLVQTSRFRPALLRDSATGLGLLGDRQLVPDLIGMLREARSLASQAAIASALGQIGDRRALKPLLELAQDRSLTDRARAFAIVGIGIVGDPRPLPWNTLLATDLNYGASTPTLTNASGTGVLDIL